jgi:gamma-glutamyltranspeptidase/glutathione hydrolase
MLHARIETMRLGFGDARAFVCDPDFANDREECTTGWLLDEVRVSERAMGSFDGERAAMHGHPDSTSCTVSFQVVDGDGNAISSVNRYAHFFHLSPLWRMHA